MCVVYIFIALSERLPIFLEAVSTRESSVDTELGVRLNSVAAAEEKAAKRQQQPLSAERLVGVIRDDAAVETHRYL